MQARARAVSVVLMDGSRKGDGGEQACHSGTGYEAHGDGQFDVPYAKVLVRHRETDVVTSDPSDRGGTSINAGYIGFYATKHEENRMLL